MKCRHCHADLRLEFLDLGSAPPSNAYLDAAGLRAPERWYPLRLLVCQQCWLVQTEDFTEAESLFDADYAYFSSYSSTWLTHAKSYVHAMVARLQLRSDSLVVEVAANDGYLLQYVNAAGIPCYGIEPTASTAKAAQARGIQIEQRFFGVALAEELAHKGRCADLMVANNVLAHVPDINDFVGGFARLLKPHGVATFEFRTCCNWCVNASLTRSIMSISPTLSLSSVQTIFSANGLHVFDVEQHPTHGGSLRVFAQRQDTGLRSLSEGVSALLDEERKAGMREVDFYKDFQPQANRIKRELLTFLLSCAEQGKTVAGYGAAAKGNTLLNFSGVRADLFPYVVDKNPAKQGRFLPGSRIPILKPDYLIQQKPDYVLILPWNLKNEVVDELCSVGDWTGRFVVAVPTLQIV
jgi:2-polyprenyl-3-methyl-5-hydroxy-6-metoxy-1,4-benzoquinol methylase